MSAEPMHERRPAWRVIRALHREIARQNPGQVGRLDEYGRCQAGELVLDLAVLSDVCEQSLRAEFGR